MIATTNSIELIKNHKPQLSATRALLSKDRNTTPPTVKDISLYMLRPPVILEVHNVYRVTVELMSSWEVPVWPDQDVGFVERMVAGVRVFVTSITVWGLLWIQDESVVYIMFLVFSLRPITVTRPRPLPIFF
jgi:hypothetical protein